MVFSGASFPLFPPNVTMVIMAKQFNFSLIRPQDMSPKIKVFVPVCFANCNLAFLCRFWSNGFFLAEWPFSPCQYRTRFTVDDDTLLQVSASIFTRSFAFVLGLIRTFPTKARSSLGHRTRLLPERYDGWTFPCCLCRWTWHLQASGNCTQGWTRLVQVHTSLPDFLADFFLYSHVTRTESSVFEVCL